MTSLLLTALGVYLAVVLVVGVLLAWRLGRYLGRSTPERTVPQGKRTDAGSHCREALATLDEADALAEADEVLKHRRAS